jgi:mercuric ion transport protein
MSVDDAGQQSATGALSPHPSNSLRWLAGAGLVTGLGAVVGSSCCVLPLGLATLGAGAGVFGVLNEVAAWRIPLLAVSAMAVVSGWGSWWMKRREACDVASYCTTQNREKSTVLLLIPVSIIVTAAASWAYIDPLLIRIIRSR